MSTVYNTIEELRQANEDQKEIISDLEREVKVARQAANTVNEIHNKNRIKFENEKMEMYKQHRVEIKAWKKDLGNMTRKHVNLEKKLKILTSRNEPKEYFLQRY